jgi:hypothetical protein
MTVRMGEGKRSSGIVVSPLLSEPTRKHRGHTTIPLAEPPAQAAADGCGLGLLGGKNLTHL